ncbi:hypothetical protein BDAP_000145 [Binucleata daphniae]
MKQKLDKKSIEILSVRQHIEEVEHSTKDIIKNIKAVTLKEQADKQVKNNVECCQDIVYSFLDEILETKGMIVENEKLVFDIIYENKEEMEDKE